jgi:superfamily II DNA or RNA helicase
MASALPLRPYQDEALDAIQSAIDRDLHCILISLPTGTGKTIFFCNYSTRFE